MCEDSALGAGHPEGHSCSGCFMILVTGDSRFVQRESSPLRHPGHVTNSHYSKEEGAALSPTITLKQYIAGIQAREMDSFSAGGSVITVDTTDFSKVDWEKLFQEIECFCMDGNEDVLERMRKQ